MTPPDPMLDTTAGDLERSGEWGRREGDRDMEAMRAKMAEMVLRLDRIDISVERMAKATEKTADILMARAEWLGKVFDRVPWWGWLLVVAMPVLMVACLLMVVQGYGPQLLQALP